MVNVSTHLCKMKSSPANAFIKPPLVSDTCPRHLEPIAAQRKATDLFCIIQRPCIQSPSIILSYVVLGIYIPKDMAVRTVTLLPTQASCGNK